MSAGTNKQGITEVPTSGNKIRKNISISTTAVEMAEGLAEKETRSVSNLLEVLIQREHERVNAPKADDKEKAA